MSRDIKNAFYLASSWFWCIGAFFPLILIEGYGSAALIAFVFFNVLGATWFSYHYKNGDDKLFREKHRVALNIFSVITIAYQVCFIFWLALALNFLCLLAISAIFVAIFCSARRYIVELSVVVYALSIALFAYYAQGETVLPTINVTTQLPHIIIPIALGFLFSPYLDLTFHRAYQESRNPKFTFTVGFLVLFFALLFFVFCYANELGDLLLRGQVSAPTLYPVIAFLTLQLSFTIAAHMRELSLFNQGMPRKVSISIGAICAVLLTGMFYLWDRSLPFFQYFSTDSIPSWAELIYKSFLLFFGLVFPLYFLFSDRKNIFLLLLIIALPAYFFAFLVGVEYSYLLSIAMAVIAIGWLIKLKITVSD